MRNGFAGDDRLCVETAVLVDNFEFEASVQNLIERHRPDSGQAGRC